MTADLHVWSETRGQIIDQFGETPGAQLEQQIIDHFVDDPEHLLRAVTRIAAAYRDGKVRSPWPVLLADLNRASQADVVADNRKGRAKDIQRARTWIANAGAHFPSWAEVSAHLFGDDRESPTLAFLEQLDTDTRQAPGRAIYGRLLVDTIARTKREGQRTIPGNQNAMLRAYSTDHTLRAELETEWQQAHERAQEDEWSTSPDARTKTPSSSDHSVQADRHIAAGSSDSGSDTASGESLAGIAATPTATTVADPDDDIPW